jgi:hypothetical protein
MGSSHLTARLTVRTMHPCPLPFRSIFSPSPTQHRMDRPNQDLCPYLSPYPYTCIRFRFHHRTSRDLARLVLLLPKEFTNNEWCSISRTAVLSRVPSAYQKLAGKQQLSTLNCIFFKFNLI